MKTEKLYMAEFCVQLKKDMDFSSPSKCCISRESRVKLKVKVILSERSTIRCSEYPDMISIPLLLLINLQLVKESFALFIHSTKAQSDTERLRNNDYVTKKKFLSQQSSLSHKNSFQWT